MQQFAYPDAKAQWVVIVAGGGVDDGDRRKWNLSADEVCAKQSQGVILDGGALRASPSMHQGGIYCKEKGVDEKEFQSFAHEPAKR